MPFVMEIFVHNSFRTVHRSRSHGDPGVRTPTEIWLWGLLWLNPHKNFTERNLISAKLNIRSGYISLQNVRNRQVTRALPQTPLGELTSALLRSPSWWRGEHALRKNPNLATHQDSILRASTFPWTHTML